MKRSGPIKRRTRLRPMSTKRQREAKLYSAKRKAFLEAHPYDQAIIKIHGLNEQEVIKNDGLAGWGIPQLISQFAPTIAPLHPMDFVPFSNDIHHVKGRVGSNYLDESTWLAVSRFSHDWIHSNPKRARELGLLA